MSELLAKVPRRVRVVEVGPRDGLQNESLILETSEKLQLVRILSDAGFDEIEVSAFVHPERVPQVADAAELYAELTALEPRPNVRYSALVPNRKGLDRAVASGARAISLFTAASETFNQENVGMPVAKQLDGFRELMGPARENGLRVRAYVSTAFHCPFEGEIAPEQVRPVVEALVEMGVDEVSVGDTIGHAVPTEVARLTEALLPVLPIEKFAYHFHDTRGAALANVLMALQYGIAIYDSSAGGIGGCPFAPGAAGNLATEDLVGMLDGMGIETGVDVRKVMDASLYMEAILGRYLISKYLLSEGGAGGEDE